MELRPYQKEALSDGPANEAGPLDTRMKTCTCCKQQKEPSEFNRQGSAPDGLSPRCRECKRASDRASYKNNRQKRLDYQKAYRAEHADKVRAYDRIRGKVRREANPRGEYLRQVRWKLLNPDKAKAKWQREQAERLAAGKINASLNTKKQRAKHPLRHKARRAVEAALKSGRLTKKPCCICGESNAHAHHDSYKEEDRLNVRWFCRPHHDAWHRVFVAED